jgi:hypothetical protein
MISGIFVSNRFQHCFHNAWNLRIHQNLVFRSLWFILLFGLTTGAQSHPGDGLIVDKHSNIYFGWIQPFTGPGHVACVWKIDKQGQAHPILSSQHEPRGAQSSNLFVVLGLDGKIYCSERQYLGERNGHDTFIADLWSIDATGNKTRILGPEQGRSPFGGGSLAVNREGIIFHATDRTLIHKRNPDGSKVVLAGSTRGHQDGKGRDAQFDNLGTMAWGPAEKLYVQDGDSIRIVDQDGTVTTLARGLTDIENPNPPQLGQSHFFDIAVDDEGNVFGSDWGYRRVFKISSTGEKSTLYRSKQPWSPEGIATFENALYVLETTGPALNEIKPRVLKRSVDGMMTTIFETSD